MIKKATIFILSIIGFLISVKLTQVYFNANFVLDAGPSFCTITKTINCDAVAQSKFAVFLGIPLAIWGMMLYLFLMFLTFVDEIGKFKLFGFLKALKNPLNYIYVVSFVSLAVSIVLAMISFFIINKICVLCFATYLIDATIVIISGLKTNFVESVKICFSDLKEFLSEIFTN